MFASAPCPACQRTAARRRQMQMLLLLVSTSNPAVVRSKLSSAHMHASLDTIQVCICDCAPALKAWLTLVEAQAHSTLLWAQQGLDGQSISDSDRAAAADWGTRQAQQQAADPAVEDSNTPDPAASAPGLPGLSSRAAAVPKSGLPGSPRRGVTLTKGKSTGLKPRKSGETPVGSFDQQRSSIQTPATDSAGVPELPTAQGTMPKACLLHRAQTLCNSEGSCASHLIPEICSCSARCAANQCSG